MKTSAQAEAEGYTIDRHVYPWFGYKGPRFRPTEKLDVLTDREAELLALLLKLEMHCQVRSPITIGNPIEHIKEGKEIRAEIRSTLTAAGISFTMQRETK